MYDLMTSLSVHLYSYSPQSWSQTLKRPGQKNCSSRESNLAESEGVSKMGLLRSQLLQRERQVQCLCCPINVLLTYFSQELGWKRSSGLRVHDALWSCLTWLMVVLCQQCFEESARKYLEATPVSYMYSPVLIQGRKGLILSLQCVCGGAASAEQRVNEPSWRQRASAALQKLCSASQWNSQNECGSYSGRLVTWDLMLQWWEGLICHLRWRLWADTDY